MIKCRHILREGGDSSLKKVSSLLRRQGRGLTQQGISKKKSQGGEMTEESSRDQDRGGVCDFCGLIMGEQEPRKRTPSGKSGHEACPRQLVSSWLLNPMRHYIPSNELPPMNGDRNLPSFLVEVGAVIIKNKHRLPEKISHTCNKLAELICGVPCVIPLNK